MSRWSRILLTLTVALAALGSLPAAASPALAQDGPEQPSINSMTMEQMVTCEPDGVQASGAVYRICMPPNWWWNGDLVIYAHGYVAATEPVAIPEDQLCLPGDGPCLPDIINVLGYAFATTSYSTNGLAVEEGVADVVDLVNVFAQTHGQPENVYLIGVSEGGLITALTTEQYANVFDGGVAACGPVGDFRYQVNYFGNFRAVFDYFYPGLIPGDPVNVPPALVPVWEDYYQANVKPVIFDPANASKLQQLMAVSKAPVDPLTRPRPPSYRSKTPCGTRWWEPTTPRPSWAASRSTTSGSGIAARSTTGSSTCWYSASQPTRPRWPRSTPTFRPLAS